MPLPGALGPLTDELRAFATGPAARVTVLSGIPLDADPHAILAIVSKLVGSIAKQDGEGDYVMEIKDAPAGPPDRPFYANSRAFPLHTDLSYVATPPQVMAMHSVANDPADGGSSLFADCEEVCNALPMAWSMS